MAGVPSDMADASIKMAADCRLSIAAELGTDTGAANLKMATQNNLN